MSQKRELISQKKLPSNGEIVDFLKEFGQRMEVAIEATPSWYWIYDHLAEVNDCDLIILDRNLRKIDGKRHFKWHSP